MRFELYRNLNQFLIQCFDNVNLSIDVLKIDLFLRKVDVLDSVSLAIESVMKSVPAKYPLEEEK